MTKLIVPESNVDDAGLLELGFALGQSHTFGLVAGRCSAAQAEGIRRLREEKLFKQRCEKWDDFCPAYLKMSRAEADRIVRLLDEFGPSYFELSQLIRISAETFRAIAPTVSDGVLHHNGEAIPINAENYRKVAAVVAEMRRALPKKTAEPGEIEDLSREPDIQQRIHNMVGRCVAILAEVDRIAREQNSHTTRICVYTELSRLQDQMLRFAA